MHTASIKRIVYLDGVRGFAILLVVIAHLNTGVFPYFRPWIAGISTIDFHGGFLGVQLFFVLSGLLITKHCLDEFEENGSLNIWSFYQRRFFRLVPALLVSTSIFLLFFRFFRPSFEMDNALGSAFFALTYTTNIRGIFERIPDGGWLNHTWSLAVEEQFYIFWPLFLYMSLKISKKLPIAIILGGCAFTIFLRSFSRSDQINYEFLRMDAILIGCLMAFSNKRPARIISTIGAIFFLWWLFKSQPRISNFEYFMTGIASALLIIEFSYHKWICSSFFRYFGSISYGLYLWHMLIGRLALPSLWTLCIAILLAHMSHKFIEKPFIDICRQRLNKNTLTPIKSPVSL